MASARLHQIHPPVPERPLATVYWMDDVGWAQVDPTPNLGLALLALGYLGLGMFAIGWTIGWTIGGAIWAAATWAFFGGGIW